MNADYTHKQGQYLAFIYHYTKINRPPPAVADIQWYFRVLGYPLRSGDHNM